MDSNDQPEGDNEAVMPLPSRIAAGHAPTQRTRPPASANVAADLQPHMDMNTDTPTYGNLLDDASLD
ncbi:TPA: hypothetical protein ACGW0S_004664, partial [Stenotrophomonas maltophilia]